MEKHTIDLHIHLLRHKIDSDPAHRQCIATVRGIGNKQKSEQFVFMKSRLC